MTVRIRVFEPGDHAGAYALWARTPGMGLSAADAAAEIHKYLERNPALSFVAEEAGTIIGTILCGHDGRRGLIHHLATDAAYRRRGIARQLLNAGLAALNEAGIARCHLLVFRDNAEGVAFWRHMCAELRDDIQLFSINTPH